MDFLAFTYVGIAVGILYLLLPGTSRLGPTSAIAAGILGAWGGALGCATLVQGGWASSSLLPPALAGSVVAAMATEVVLDVLVGLHRARERHA